MDIKNIRKTYRIKISIFFFLSENTKIKKKY